jgi:hypothetical protein
LFEVVGGRDIEFVCTKDVFEENEEEEGRLEAMVFCVGTPITID